MQILCGFICLYKKVFIYLTYNLKQRNMKEKFDSRQCTKFLHPEYKGIQVLTDRRSGVVKFSAFLAKNKSTVGKHFDCVNQAVKWLDMQCVIQGIPQKNNTFKKI